MVYILIVLLMNYVLKYPYNDIIEYLLSLSYPVELVDNDLCNILENAIYYYNFNILI